MKKNLLLRIVFIFLFQFFIFNLFGQHTFSIVAVDTVTGEVGSAGASCIDDSKIISDVHPGVGAIHTQAAYNAFNQSYASGLMNKGYTSQQIIDSVVKHDSQNNSKSRQYGAVELKLDGNSYAFTGSGDLYYAGDIYAPTYSIQGNILLGPQILDSIQARFLRAQGPLACKLMQALLGAKVPGADSRCAVYGISTLSAFLRVAEPTDASGHLTIDLNVNSVPTDSLHVIDPIDSLHKIFNQAVDICPFGTNVISTEEKPLIKISVQENHSIFIQCNKKMKRISLMDEVGRELFSQNAGGKFTNQVLLPNSHQLFLVMIEFADGKFATRKILSP